MESVFSSLLASSLLVGLPSVIFVFVIVYISFGMFKKKFSPKESFPPIVGIYITKCLYSITYYWEKIVPQLKFLRVTHDFIVFQCLSVIFTLKIIDYLQDGPKSVQELSKFTNSSEKNLNRVMKALTTEGFFSYSEETGKFQNNNISKPKKSMSFDNLDNCLTTTSQEAINNNSNISSTHTSPIYNTLKNKRSTPTSIINSNSTSNKDSNNLSTFMESKDSFYLDGFNGNFQYDTSNEDPNNISSILSMLQHPTFIESWQKLKECVQSSVPGFQIKHGVSFFQYIDEKDSFLKKIFDCSMKQKNQLLKINQQICQIFNFSDYKIICDVGGGVGFLGFEILKKHHSSDIIILELEDTVKNGVELANFDKTKRHYLQSERITFSAGDMFQPSSIPKANLYTLMQVIHDWSDQDAIRILTSISTVMKKQLISLASGGSKPRLLIIDTIIDENISLDYSSKSIAISDIVMMAIVGGEERTKKQWEFLFQESNLNLINISKFNCPPYLSIMELIAM